MREKGTKRKKVLKGPFLWLSWLSAEADPCGKDLHPFS